MHSLHDLLLRGRSRSAAALALSRQCLLDGALCLGQWALSTSVYNVRKMAPWFHGSTDPAHLPSILPLLSPCSAFRHVVGRRALLRPLLIIFSLTLLLLMVTPSSSYPCRPRQRRTFPCTVLILVSQRRTSTSPILSSTLASPPHRGSRFHLFLAGANVGT